MSLCAPRRGAKNNELAATSLSTLVQMVAAGIGVTMLPQMAVEVEARADRALICLPFAKPTPSRTISLAWRPSSSRGAEFRLLGEHLSQAAPRSRRLLKKRR